MCYNAEKMTHAKRHAKPKISLKNQEHRYIIDKVVMVTGLIGPVASVPQAIQIYASQDATSVSLISWSLFIVTNGALLIYALVHKLPPLIISNICWVAIELIVVAGILIYS